MLEFAVVVLFVWLFVIQCKQVEITDCLNDIRKEIKGRNKDNKDENLSSQVVLEECNVPMDNSSSSEDVALELLQNDEPISINDISDDAVFSAQISAKQDNSSNSVKVENDEKQSFENLFLGNIFNKIGALAILVGLIIFIKLISPYFVFTAGMKLALGYLVGLGFMFGAWKLHDNDKMKSYSEVLLGTGFGTMFITTYCGATILNLLNAPVAGIIATALLLASFKIADKMKTVSMLVITLIAGYLNPFFINADLRVEPNFLMGYLIFVNILGLIYSYKNKSRNVINIINLVLTLCFMLFTSKVGIVGPAVLWAIYFVYDLIVNVKEYSVDNRFLNYINLGVFVLLTALNLVSDVKVGIVMLVVAILYAGVAFTKSEHKEMLKNYIHLALTAFGFSVFFITASYEVHRVYIWAIETVVLAYFAMKFQYKELLNWAVGVWTAAAVTLLCIDDVVCASSIKNFTPFWNIRLAVFAPIILSSFAVTKLCSKLEDEKFKSLVNVFKVEYISMLYLYLGFEANDIINKMFVGNNTSATFVRNMTNVILGFVYTIQFKRLYNATQFKLFQIASSVVGLISLVYLMCAGCNYRPSTAFIPVVNIRVVAFLSAIGASVLYARWSKSEAFKYLAILLGFVLVHTEIKDSMDRFVWNNADYLLSVGWILYAGIITALGIFRDKQYMKFAGIALCILSIIRIFIFDLAHVDILYKFIAFLTLGTILLVLSYFYNKKQK